MAVEQENVVDTPTIRVNYVYSWCNDIAAMRQFYTELLGMKETAYKDDGDFNWLCFDCGSFQFMVFNASDEAVPVHSEWSAQPGWDGGTIGIPSWSVEIPAADFAKVVEKISASGAPLFSDYPTWCQDSYWSFPVRDPMGNTVEVSSMPKEKPESTVWLKPEDT